MQTIIHIAMKVINLGEQNSVLNSFVAQMRDKSVQKDSMRFRRNLERVGEIFAYEISRCFDYSPRKVETPLGTASVPDCDDSLVIAAILRAGLPLHQGLLNFFDNAKSAFVATYRKYIKGDDFTMNVEYASSIKPDGKVLVIADAVLATGASLKLVYDRLLEEGAPKYTHLVCPICSAYAVEHLQMVMPYNVTLWVAAIDEELTSHSYIVPGLGDAGDLAYGEKSE